jgi:hypothetical protein
VGKLKTHENFIKELEIKNKGFNKTFNVTGTYENANKKIEVITKYGSCEVSPNSLLRDYLPTISSAKNRNDFCIKMFTEVHGNLYDYSDVEYVRSKTKVKINCKKHGCFYQIPKEHLKGSGCPICAKLINSFSFEQWKDINKDNKAILYVIECSNTEESFIKVGITSLSTKERYKGAIRMPYPYSIVYELATYNRKLVWDTEKEVKEFFKKYNTKLKFKGSSQECFDIRDKDNILKLINLKINEAIRRD